MTGNVIIMSNLAVLIVEAAGGLVSKHHCSALLDLMHLIYCAAF